MALDCVCGYSTEDEIEFLAHLVECESNPEERWASYVGPLENEVLPFRNSEILEEE